MRPPLIGRLGKSVGRHRGALVGGAVAAGAATGFVKGLSSQDMSSGIYEMATGQQDIDNYVFGTDMGVRELVFPAPGLGRTAQKVRMARQGQLYSRYGSANRSGYFNNNLPTVNGDLVLGAYHSRMG